MALLAVPVIAMASAVHADDFHIRSGDLSQPQRAASFQRDVDSAANALCSSYNSDAAYIANVQSCRTAVRDEAMSQLSPSQREKLLATTPTFQVASER